MSKKIPPDRDKDHIHTTKYVSQNSDQQKNLTKISDRQNLKTTDSTLQMNSNTQQATEKLKEILQGKFITDKRETSIGRLKRKLKELFNGKNIQHKKRLKITEASIENIVQPEQPARDRQSQPNTDSVKTDRLEERTVQLPPRPQAQPVL